MSYENPPLPEEDVNVGRENVLVEFLRLAAGLAVVVVALSAVLYFGGGWLARQIAFETERKWVGDDRVIGLSQAAASGDADAAIENYLQTLAGQLAAHMALPQGMSVQLHYAGLPEPNAFASLGGHIAVTRGLYERIDSENALALVLAHEIAHVRARDPIASMGGGATLLMAMTLLTGDAARLSGAFASLIQRGYSRRAETRADMAALAAVQKQYGHAGGGAAVFQTLARYRDEHGIGVPTLLSTHPLSAERIQRLETAAAGWDPQRQPLLPLAVPARESPSRDSQH